MNTSPLHPVLVIGGGLVGSSLAIVLNRAGIPAALAAASAAGRLPAVFDQCNLSLAEATVNALSALHASIASAQQRQIPWDSPQRLSRWARTRQSDNTLATQTFDAINRVFSNAAVLPTLLRGHLLTAANHLPGLSFLLGRHALGG